MAARSTLALAAILLLATPSLAFAAPCTEAISAGGRAANPKNYDPPRHYDMKALAKSRAIAKWQAKVGERCQRSSKSWWRARQKSVTCEGYAGGTACTVSAVPARRMF